MTRVGVIIHPLDALFFRGGRPFGEGLRAESGLPAPQVFSGLIRTLLLQGSGADFNAMRAHRDMRAAFRAAGAEWVGEVQCRGPWLAECKGGGIRPFIPTPADVRAAVDGGFFALRPRARPVPGWSPPQEGMAPLWSGGRRATKTAPEFLNFAGLQRYLAGGALDAGHFNSGADLFEWEERTGVGIDPVHFASQEGRLYSVKNLRLRQNVGFYGEVDLPEGRESLLRRVTAWGGEQRQVAVEPVKPVDWPQAPSPNQAVLLISPAFFPSRWRPDRYGPNLLRGAAVRGPFAVSGWDLTRGGPKPARFGVGAGTVYFLEGEELASQLCSSGEDAALGYGAVLKGTWNYAE